eukprot:170941-Chlamydomonas_euryale.AAC.1
MPRHSNACEPASAGRPGERSLRRLPSWKFRSSDERHSLLLAVADFVQPFLVCNVWPGSAVRPGMGRIHSAP